MSTKAESSLGDSCDCSCLLELAANNDLVGFKKAVEDGAKVEEVESWYGRQNGGSQMILEQRTPAMIASLYGSLDVLTYILDCYKTCGGNINRSCGSDGSTALHCAAAGGSPSAIEIVVLLLSFGADLNALDAQGRCPCDVIVVSPKYHHTKVGLEFFLKGIESVPLTSAVNVPSKAVVDIGITKLSVGAMHFSNVESVFESVMEYNEATQQDSKEDNKEVNRVTIPPLHPPPFLSHEMSGSSVSSPFPSSPKSPSKDSTKGFGEDVEKIRGFPVDPSLPDIKNGIYTTDEFRMFSFKVRPCSRAYSHDWTECPFVHPGENARRRDPRRYHYSCVPCPDFRKGACRRGDACEYAHGVFECWLHPAQYRTRLCKDGMNCMRRVCFFAHNTQELRPLYVSTGSAVTSARATCPSELSLIPLFGPASPSSVLMMPPFSPSNLAQSTLPTPPMSPPPSSSSSSLLGGTWPQSNNVPTLQLPGMGPQMSRLRAALSAKDLPLDDVNEFCDFDAEVLDVFASSSQTVSSQARLNAAIAAASGCSARAGKYRNSGGTILPTNLEGLFASEMVPSPRSAVEESAFFKQLTAQLQVHKSSQIHSQLQNSFQVFPQAMQTQLQKGAVDCQMQDHAQLQSSTEASSSSGMGTLSHLFGFDIEQQKSTGISLPIGAMAARATFAKSDKLSHSSRDLGGRSVLSDWGSPTGKPEWGLQGDDLCKFRKTASFDFRKSEEPDLSRIPKVVKEEPLDADSTVAETLSDGACDGHKEVLDNTALRAWIEQMHLDQIAA